MRPVLGFQTHANSGLPFSRIGIESRLSTSPGSLMIPMECTPSTCDGLRGVCTPYVRFRAEQESTN